MACVAQGIERGGVILGRSRTDLSDVQFGNLHEPGGAAVRINTDDAHLLAGMPMPGSPLEAPTACQVQFHRYEMAFTDCSDLGCDLPPPRKTRDRRRPADGCGVPITGPNNKCADRCHEPRPLAAGPTHPASRFLVLAIAGGTLWVSNRLLRWLACVPEAWSEVKYNG